MLLENTKLALASIAANKLRTFLTVLGIIIGVASVIAIMTIGDSTTAQSMESYARFGTNNVSVAMYISDATAIDTSEGSENYIANFSEDMLLKLLQAYGDKIDAISVAQYMNASGKATVAGAATEDIYAYVYLQGVNSGYFEVESMSVPIIAGHVFTAKEMEEQSYYCIVSDKLVNNLFQGDTEKALGQKITVPVNMDESGNVQTADYTIVGVYQLDMSDMYDMGGSEKDITTQVYIPYLNAKTYSSDKQQNALSYFTIKIRTGEDVLSLTTEIAAFLNSLLDENSVFQVEAYNNQSWIETMEQEERQQTVTTALIAAIALLVGGIGVMNIMTVTITERTREIGTRKALGAPNRDIRLQFITEAVIICIIGGAIGILSGVSAGWIACRFIKNIPMVLSWESVLGSFAVSFAIGVFFGYYPANKASKMEVIDALRYE